MDKRLYRLYSAVGRLFTVFNLKTFHQKIKLTTEHRAIFL